MPSATTLRRVAGAALVLLVVSFGLFWRLMPVPAQAVVPGAAEGDGGRLVLVLDSSGSMQERSSGGQTKIAAAKQALNRVIGSLPDDQAVGLRVYGAEVFSRGEPGACTDSQLVVPVGSGNRDQLRSAVSSYRPFGETPIGYALQEAGKDLGGEGKRTIVLVSDGEPTCDPDPCKVARDLSEQGVDLKIDVVGLDVDGAARDKLRCIAGAGNGTYYDVDSAEEFAASLEKLATRAGRPFSAIGQPVAGTPSADGAPVITAGDWLDELGTTETGLVKNYTIEREITGSTLHVSASLRTATSTGETVGLELATTDGQQCGTDSAFTQLSAGQLISAGAIAGGVSTLGEVTPDDPCVTADTLVATVTDKATSVVGPRPLEVRVIEEPSVESTDGLPEAATTGSFMKPPGGRSTKTTGGSSFADAPLLEPGSYRDSILPGEVLTYQVDLEWGQQLATRIDFPRPGSQLAQATGNLDMFTRVDAFGPGRRLATNNSLAGTPTSQAYLPTSALTTGVGTSAVTYLNRTGTGAAKGTALAGRYTVTVFLEEDPDGESYLVPFTMGLGVTGDVRDGPGYTEEPAEVESATPDQETSTGSPTDSASESPSEDETASSDTAGGGPSAGFIVGGLGLLALLAAGYVVLTHRTG
ncbi:MAG: vWA domain-containing protein [Nocardioides sp.]